MADLFHELASSVQQNAQHNAFCFNNAFHSYQELAAAISNIRAALLDVPSDQKMIGLVANDDLETYASIIAIWFEGRAYVPIDPATPLLRAQSMIEQADIKYVLCSGDVPEFASGIAVRTAELPSATMDLAPKKVSLQDNVYLLFTSGSTGKPKGVPITLENLSAFIDSFWALGISLDHTDRCLQMFELTFDLSVMSYLAPLLKGACVHPVPKGAIKYSTIFEMMEDHALTISLMVPSILNYLRPYFEEINCPKMRYSLFCGEALPLQVCEEWSQCLPNATLLNVYGPTEATIFCTSYEFVRGKKNKAHHGVLSIGKPMINTEIVIVDDDLKPFAAGTPGEMCLAGAQVTPGYWKDRDGKNEAAFFNLEHNGLTTRFYRSGDVCYEDKDGDLQYAGRVDHQVKIQGFRVELSEIEHHVRLFLGSADAVAVATTNSLGNHEIGLVIADGEVNKDELLAHLRTAIPTYMLPTSIRTVKEFPHNVNGKIDRGKLTRNYDSL